MHLLRVTLRRGSTRGSVPPSGLVFRLPRGRWWEWAWAAGGGNQARDLGAVARRCNGARSPSVRKTSSKGPQNLVSRSWMRKLTFSSVPSIARFLACSSDPAECEWALTAARWTRLVESSMKKSTYRVFSLAVSTVKKSQARIAAACWPRSCLHMGPPGRGAGPRPWRRTIVRMAVAETAVPSFNSSPRILW